MNQKVENILGRIIKILLENCKYIYKNNLERLSKKYQVLAEKN